MHSGFLLINKPSGPTSHDIIGILRKITGIKKIGHAGTLDPFASGLLIVGVGREATKNLDKFLKSDKSYVATLKFGVVSDTYDRTGQIKLTDQTNNEPIKQEAVEKVLKKFMGEIEQIPPMYSAKKVNGKKLYELARKGIEINRTPTTIKIFKLQVIEYKHPDIVIDCKVSSGTYIRSLAHDIGQNLGCGALLENLERTEIKDYKLSESIDPTKLNSDNWYKYLKIL